MFLQKRHSEKKQSKSYPDSQGVVFQMGTRLKLCCDTSLTWTRCFWLLRKPTTLSKVNAGQFLLLVFRMLWTTGRTENHQVLYSLLLLGSAVAMRSNSVTLTEKGISSRMWEVCLCCHWFSLKTILKNKVVAWLPGTSGRLPWARRQAES